MAEGNSYSPESPPQLDKTRRNLLKVIGAAAISMPGILKGRQKFLERSITPAGTVEVKPSLPDQKTEANGVPFPASDSSKESLDASLEQIRISETAVLAKELTGINQVPVFTPERTAKEVAYVKDTMRLDEVDKGLWVLGNKSLRSRLIGKRHTLRNQLHASIGNQKAEFMNKNNIPESELHNTLSKEEEIWCDANGIHPEILAACKDAMELAAPVIAALQEKHPDQFRKRITVNGVEHVENPTDLLVPPYAMAMLYKQETAGFQGIGDVKAYDALTSTAQKEALVTYAQQLSAETGIKFLPQNIIGSMQGSGDSSGGALGAQFMPNNALIIDKLFKEVDPHDYFNVFDLMSSMKGAYIFLARHQDHGLGRDNEGNELIRYGYSADETPTHIKYSILKWNPSATEATEIVHAMVPKGVVTPFPGSKYPRQLAA